MTLDAFGRIQSLDSPYIREECKCDEVPVTVPSCVLLRAYGALSAAEWHLRNLPATRESDDVRVRELCKAAFDAITEATGIGDESHERARHRAALEDIAEHGGRRTLGGDWAAGCAREALGPESTR